MNAPPENRANQLHLAIESASGLAMAGWAHDPDGTARLELTIGGQTLMPWPRTIARSDVDRALGAPQQRKGFWIPTGAVATALALTPPAARPPEGAAIRFGPEAVAILPGAPVGPTNALHEHIADVWLCDSHHLRLRTHRSVVSVTVAQIDTALQRTHETIDRREAIVTAPLKAPFAPVLIGLDTDTGSVLGVIPFPSLLRGGRHAAEGFAMSAGDPDRLADYGYDIAHALITRPQRRALAHLGPPHTGLEPGADPQLAGFLRQHTKGQHTTGQHTNDSGAKTPSIERDEIPTLSVTRDEIPTLAALAGGGTGRLCVEPQPSGTLTLLSKPDVPSLSHLLPASEPPTPSDPPDTGRPQTIRFTRHNDADITTLLFPIAPDPSREAARAAPPTLTIALSPEVSIAPHLTSEGLPPDIPVLAIPVLTIDGPTPAAALSTGGPVLFLDRAIAIHDPRTLHALANMVACAGIATAGCLIVREAHHSDTAATDRIASGGLFPSAAAADQPWRPPLSALSPWPHLFRDRYPVAANHPSCVMVSAATLAAHGDGLTRWDARDLLTLMHRASAAGLIHATTTWFSVYDRRPEPPPLPASPLPALPAAAATTLRRLL